MNPLELCLYLFILVGCSNDPGDDITSGEWAGVIECPQQPGPSCFELDSDTVSLNYDTGVFKFQSAAFGASTWQLHTLVTDGTDVTFS